MPYSDPIKRKEYLRQYKLDHKEELAERERQRYLKTYVPHPRPQVSAEHKRKVKARADKKYITVHRDRKTEGQLRWRRSNAKRLNAEIKNRRHTDICFRLKCNLRSRLHAALIKHYKTGSAVRDLGCDIDEFRTYLESKFLTGMNWNNYGQWHLDHIIPLCRFDLSIREQFCKATHYTNYQPLWGSDNCRKNKF